MKRLIVLSDSHGNAKGISDLLPLIAENDYVIHLGDGAADMREARGLYPKKVYACAGNCDFFSPLPEDGVLEVEGINIYFCHGHRYGVKSDLHALALAAKGRNCAVALYGHTHVANIREIEGVTLINPGTLHRAVGKGGSYCYLVVHKEKVTPVIVGEQYQ